MGVILLDICKRRELSLYFKKEKYIFHFLAVSSELSRGRCEPGERSRLSLTYSMNINVQSGEMRFLVLPGQNPTGLHTV